MIRPVIVAGLTAPNCEHEWPCGQHCILHAGHRPNQSPSGPHVPNRAIRAQKPDHVEDTLRMRAWEDDGRGCWPITDQLPYGDFRPGRYAWLLTDITPLAEPVPFKGGQGLSRTWGA
jgi:hypothetical protein